MKCAKCSSALQSEWKFCPECGAALNFSFLPDSHPAAVFFPQAFERQPYAIACLVAETSEFYQTFVRYVAAFLSDVRQLVHFRAKIVGEVFHQVGKSRGSVPLTHICWAAMSLATDRFFSEKALMYEWSPGLESELRSGWYELIAPAFVPSARGTRVAITQLKDWRARFLEAHQRNHGPLAACPECTSKCFYHYEVSQCVEESGSLNSASTIAEIAQAAEEFCKQMFAADALDLDLAFCVAVHLLQEVQNVDANDSEDNLAPAVRKAIERSIASTHSQFGAHVRALTLQMIVEHALAGAPWREICAEPMKANAITEEEVTVEIQARTAKSS
jgi:hypothetical protein